MNALKDATGTVRVMPAGESGSMKLPCGRCGHCRIRLARELTIRCQHELQTTPGHVASFLTLTYADAHLPANYSLRKEELQKFFRAMRKKTRSKIRYLACGEYGEKTGRPHYHAIVYSFLPDDRKPWAKRKGVDYYRSELLESLWTKGNSEFSEANYRAMSYVARYTVKKAFGSEVVRLWQPPKPGPGMRHGRYLREPEFLLSSRRPGLGAHWFAKYYTDVFPEDKVTIDGKKYNVPRYYDKLYERMFPEKMEAIRLTRQENANATDSCEQTIERRRQKAEYLEYRERKNKRDFSG